MLASRAPLAPPRSCDRVSFVVVAARKAQPQTLSQCGERVCIHSSGPPAAGCQARRMPRVWPRRARARSADASEAWYHLIMYSV